MVVAHGVTHPGTVRPHNEDAILVDQPLGLFVVADGMGGANAGEVASRMAVAAIRELVARSGPTSDHTWPFGILGELGLAGNRLRTAVKLANRAVFKHAEEQARFTGMGTTVAAVLVDGARAALCGIGDSRIYSITDGVITQLTRDHTWVAALLAENPALDPASFALHPMRHVLTSVVGAQADVDVFVLERDMVDRERLLLCSDGVHRPLSDDRLRYLVESSETTADAAGRIVSAALEVDGSDNLSALVVAYEAS